LMGPPEATSVPPVRHYFVEASYGRQDVAAVVLGALSHPPPADAGACETYPTTLAETLRPMVPGTFDAYFWYLGSRISCGWNGLASLGSVAAPTRDTWYNGRLAGCTTLFQEPAHSFGLQHSSSLRCGTSQLTDDLQGCIHSEYGDVFDPMGQGCRHTNGYQKAYLGWLGGCNVVQIRRSGSFNLLPLELPCDGAQVLQIPMPKTRSLAHPDRFGEPSATDLTYYYVELRTSRGVDTGLAPSVQVRVSGDIRPPSEANHHSWILDMVPSTTDLDGLGAGDSFSDPAGGLTIRVEALGADGATVSIDLASDGGGPLCLGGTELTVPGPGIESCDSVPARPATGDGTGVGGSGGAGTGAGGSGGAGTDDGGGGDGGTGHSSGSAGSGGETGDAGFPTSDGGSGGGCGCAVVPTLSASDLVFGACILVAWRRRRPVARRDWQNKRLFFLSATRRASTRNQLGVLKPAIKIWGGASQPSS
jgi:uncharacterized membrane protein YgcG